MIIKSKASLFRDLLYFQEVVDNLQISRTAAKNGIKASNLSCIIRNLEQRLGKQLFIRHANGVTPTAEALKLSEQIKEIVSNLETVYLQTAELPKNSELRLCLPQNINFSDIRTFENNFKVKVIITHIEKNADVILSYTEIPQVNDLISVELKIGKCMEQSIWIYAVNNNIALKLAQFIICRMRSQ